MYKYARHRLEKHKRIEMNLYIFSTWIIDASVDFLTSLISTDFLDHDDRVGGNFFSKKRKGRGPFRAKMYSEASQKYRNRGNYQANPRSRLDDGDVAMSDVHDAGRSRL